MIENIIFRYLTPLFHYNYLDHFEHSGCYKDANYTIRIEGYSNEKLLEFERQNIVNELLKYANSRAIKNLQTIYLSEETPPRVAEAFLIVDVVQPFTEDRVINRISLEGINIFEGFIATLGLHATRGLAYEYTYIFCSHPNAEPLSIDYPILTKELAQEIGDYIVAPRQMLSPALGSLAWQDVSSLPNEEHELCRITFQHFLDKEWDEINTFNKLLGLALHYHRLSFSLERIDYAFLALMGTFEALFKKERETSTKPATEQIAEFLATSESESELIKNAFFEHPTNSFYKLRDSIARRNPTLDRAIVEAQYPKLYRYVTKAIIKLINIADGVIGTNYYDDLDNYVRTEFSKLKSS